MKTNLVRILMVACMLTFTHCSSDDAGPCDDFQCLNGGSIVANGDGCQCDCPPGYSGANCEKSSCAPYIECPNGTSPNPANGCACE